MSRRINEKGAVLVVELVVLAAVLVAAGFAGYQYIKNAKAVNKATSPKPHVATSNYSGWKTFCSSETAACFKYAPSWTLAECAPSQINVGDFQNCPSAETVSVIAPDKTTRINWFVDPYDPSKKVTCKPVTSTSGGETYTFNNYNDMTQVPRTSNLFFVNNKNNGSTIYDYVDTLGLVILNNGTPPTLGQPAASCQSDPSFLSRDGKYVITFQFSYAVNTNPKLPIDEQNPPPAQTSLNSVKQTLLSFYY